MIHEPISNTQNTCYFIEISLLILVQYRLPPTVSLFRQLHIE